MLKSDYENGDIFSRPDSEIRSGAMADLPRGVSEGEAIRYAEGFRAALKLYQVPAANFGRAVRAQAEAGDALILPAVLLLGLAEGGVALHRVNVALEKAAGHR